MGSDRIKAAENIYFRCRKSAARYNDRLNSREGAAELLGVSPSSVADYELGITKVMPADVVIRMADLYNAPELRNHYCRHECPLGAECVPELAVVDIDRVSLKLLSALNSTAAIKDKLLDITADGIIEEGEQPILTEIVGFLDSLSVATAELKLWTEKHLGKGQAEKL